jgi:hydroxyacylglutathione hydrolase
MDEFATGHVPGSINIVLSGQFASWAGSVLGLSSRPVLIGSTAEEIAEARVRLARVGIEALSGYLKHGVAGWQEAGFELAKIPQITVDELRSRLNGGDVQVLDVRRQAEWDAAHIDGAKLYPLDGFKAALPKLERTSTVAVHCKSGYRSMIACSLLQRAGYDIINVIGGFDAWEQAKQAAGSAVTVGAS